MDINPHALRVIRERTGLKQARLAEMANIDRPNYAHIEAGRRGASAPQIVAIAAALNVDLLAITHRELVVA